VHVGAGAEVEVDVGAEVVVDVADGRADVVVPAAPVVDPELQPKVMAATTATSNTLTASSPAGQ
jgi:hypothetical protein